MRMAYDNGFDSAEFVHFGNCLGIDVRDAVPEDVALRSANQNGPLANGEFRHRVDEGEALITLVGREFVVMVFGAKIGHGREGLA